jgi:hypothetical protein
MVRVSKRFMDELLWPIFTDLVVAIRQHLHTLTGALLPAIAPGPFDTTILDHEHGTGQLCENCLRRLVDSK